METIAEAPKAEDGAGVLPRAGSGIRPACSNAGSLPCPETSGNGLPTRIGHARLDRVSDAESPGAIFGD